MRIIVYGINYWPDLTGIGKYTGEMCKWLAASGHNVCVVTAPPYYPQWKVGDGFSTWRYRHEIIDGVEVWRTPIWVPEKVTGIKRGLHLLSFLLSSMPTVIKHYRWRPDIIIVVAPPIFASFSAFLLAKLSGAKSLLHIQDLEIDAAFDLGIVKLQWIKKALISLEKKILNKFDSISIISRRMQNKIIEKGITNSDIIYFPNWVDCESIYPITGVSPLRYELGISNEKIVLLYSGNMGKKQGLEIVIKAARILQDEANIVFVMCGYGAVYNELRAMADDLHNIVWIPLQPIEYLNSLLNMADIHLLPQYSEVADLVMPSKLTGILASGRPVIATAAEDTELWSVVTGCGINTRPGDTDAFVSAILVIAGNHELRQKLGAAARQYAMKYLERNAVLKNFEADLAHLIK